MRRHLPSQPGALGYFAPEFTLIDLPTAIIILMTQLLSIVLTSRYVRQPRVIAEVIGGVLLGPTVGSMSSRFSPPFIQPPFFR